MQPARQLHLSRQAALVCACAACWAHVVPLQGRRTTSVTALLLLLSRVF